MRLVSPLVLAPLLNDVAFAPVIARLPLASLALSRSWLPNLSRTLSLSPLNFPATRPPFVIQVSSLFCMPIVLTKNPYRLHPGPSPTSAT